MTDTSRLDVALVTAQLARSRTHAATLIQQGRVLVNHQPASKPAQPVRRGDDLQVFDDGWVSRAAHKLLGALDDLDLAVSGRALDAGASTGGFSQVLRQRGCAPVYAVDVGHDQLSPVLRADPQVIVHEGLNLRDLTLAHVDGRPVDLVVADVSFISLTLILQPLLGVLSQPGWALLMVKPQFEVGRERLGKGGVVHDPGLRQAAVDRVVSHAETIGWQETARVPSTLPGPAGNVEFFVHLTRATDRDRIDFRPDAPSHVG